jgi:hypothetical protein
MAKIPTILSDSAIRSGSTSPLGNPSELVVDDRIASGLSGLSRGVQTIAGAKLQIDQQRRQFEEVRWVNDSIGQERHYLHSWAMAELGKNDENVGENFWTHANERISQYESSAPSAKAAKAYRNQIGDFIFSRYTTLTKVGQDLKIQKTIQSVNEQTSNALGIYRESGAMPEALGELNREYERIGGYIDQVFGQLAPEKSREMRENLAIEMALGAMDKNPGFAKMIIETDKFLDERSRSSLKNQLEQSLKESRNLLVDKFEETREDHIVQAEFGVVDKPLPLRLYEAVYGKGAEAERQKRKDDFHVAVHVRANQFMEKFAPSNAHTVSAAFESLSKDVRTLEDRTVLRILDDKVRGLVQLQKTNRVAWLTQHNPEVKRLTKEVEEAATQSDRQQASSLRNVAIKKYQGRAPEKAPNPEWYLGLSTDDVSLLDVGVATETANAINKGTASEVLGQIDSLLAQFPDDQDKHIALRDLAVLPPAGQSLRPDYRMVVTHRNKFWVDSLIGAIDKVKELGKLNPETKETLGKEVDKNSTWVKFRRTHVVDNSQRADEVEGYREAILAYANALMVNQGHDPKDAVKKSIGMLVSSELGFTSVNGQPLAITKQRPNGTDRPDEEVEDLGRRLEIALEHLDPRHVNVQNFPMLKKFQTDEQKWNHFYEQLRERSFFQLSPDGQSVTVYFPDDAGLPFQVTDTNGQELRIYFDELPDFLSTTHPLSGVRRIPEFPKDQDIYTTEGNFLGLGNLFGTKRTVTNWPGMPYWIRPGIRKGAPNTVDDKFIPPDRRGNK